MASQRRHKRRKKSRGRFRGLYQVLSVFLIFLVLVAGSIVFFRVNTVTVQGNNRYSQEEIVEISGIENGDSLVLMPKNQIARKIRQQLPYVEAVAIRRALPDGVVIQVRESAVAVVIRGGGQWWLVNSAGKLLETVPSGKVSQYAKLTGVELLAPETGVQAVVSEEDAVHWQYALEFLATLDERGDLSELDSLECGATGKFTAGYGGRYTLLLPTVFADEAFNYGKLMSLLDEALPELEHGSQNVVDFTLWESTGKIFARRSE